MIALRKTTTTTRNGLQNSKWNKPTKYRSWTYSTYYCNVGPHMTLNIITRRGSVSQNVCISLKLNTIFSQGSGEERESFWNTVGGGAFPLLSAEWLQILPAACAPLQMKWTQLTDDVPQQHQSGLDLHPFDSVLMMSQSGSQYSSGRLYCPGHMHETPCFNLPSGTLQPQTATDYFMEAFRGKTRPVNKTEPWQPESTRPKVLKSPAQVQFSFNLWPWGALHSFRDKSPWEAKD